MPVLAKDEPCEHDGEDALEAQQQGCVSGRSLAQAEHQEHWPHSAALLRARDRRPRSVGRLGPPAEWL